MRNLKLRLSQFTKSTLLGLCLLLANVSFSQEKYPVLIPYENDTLIAISPYQFDIVLFAFSYVRSLENALYLTSNELTISDSVNTHLEEVIALERLKSLEKDSINVNLEKVIQDYKKARKREKLKKTFTYIGMGLVIGLEAGAITYLLVK